MSPLPPFTAKLIASDDYEEKKYFETEGAAIKWVLGAGKDQFDGDIERAEIHHESRGLVWCRNHLKVEEDARYRQMRANPNSLLRHFGIPKNRPPADIEAHCDACQRTTMHWREYEEVYGMRLNSPQTQRMLQGGTRPCPEALKARSDRPMPSAMRSMS
jgi:hypothetical protein